MANIAVITARGGSKGLPRKNVLPLDGLPLVAHTINAAIRSQIADLIVVTSDDPEILDIAGELGVTPLQRPAVLATDTASSYDTVIHTLQSTGAGVEDTLLLLQPTSPLRHHIHIAEAVTLFKSFPPAKSLFSVTEYPHHPYKSFTCCSNGWLQPLFGNEYLSMPRQKLPMVYRQNGAIYIVGVSDFKDASSFFVPPCLPYVMPESASIDIDSMEDLRHAEYLIKTVKTQ